MSTENVYPAVIEAHRLSTRGYFYSNGVTFPLTRSGLIIAIRRAKTEARGAAKRSIWADENADKIPAMVRDIYRDGAHAYANRVADLYAGLSTR